MITLRVLQGCRWNFVKFMFSTCWIVLKGGIGLLDFRTFELWIGQDPQGSTQMGYISCFHLLPTSIFRKILSSKWPFQSNIIIIIIIIITQPQSGTNTKMNLFLPSKRCFEKSFPNWLALGKPWEISCYQSDGQGLNGFKGVRQLQNDVVGLGRWCHAAVEVTPTVSRELYDLSKIDEQLQI